MKRGVQWGGVGRKGGGEGETRDDKTRGEERKTSRATPAAWCEATALLIIYCHFLSLNVSLAKMQYTHCIIGFNCSLVQVCYEDLHETHSFCHLL